MSTDLKFTLRALRYAPWYSRSSLVAHAGTIGGLVPFQPTTRRTYSRDQQLRVFTRVFTDAPGTLQTELQLKSAKTNRAVPVRTAPSKSGHSALDCEAMLNLKDLPVGTYVPEFTARLGRDRSSTRAVLFQLQ